jgi:ubiquinone/menaquinone biosynthesis C-methylase UbiE
MKRRRRVTSRAASNYDLYVRTEWDLFDNDPSRARASLEAVSGLQINRVLDVGCGAGQELLPFVAGQQAFGIGLDPAPAASRIGRELFATRDVSGRVAFVRGRAERLPFRSDDIDVIICRLALPYTRNAPALFEMARVLRPGGLVLLKFHHALYYLDKLKKAVSSADARSMAHATRVLIAGALYHLTGRQPRGRLVGGESFQSDRLLRRELSRAGLVIRGVVTGSTRRTPSLVLVKGSQR